MDATSLADLKAELFKKKNEAQKNRQQGNYRPEKVGNKFAFFIQKNSGSWNKDQHLEQGEHWADSSNAERHTEEEGETENIKFP